MDPALKNKKRKKNKKEKVRLFMMFAPTAH
jgi:hypothetical protein